MGGEDGRMGGGYDGGVIVCGRRRGGKGGVYIRQTSRSETDFFWI